MPRRLALKVQSDPQRPTFAPTLRFKATGLSKTSHFTATFQRIVLGAITDPSGYVQNAHFVKQRIHFIVFFAIWLEGGPWEGGKGGG